MPASRSTRPRPRAPKAERDGLLARALRERERELIVEQLREHAGNIGATATALGIARQNLDRKLDLYDLRAVAGRLRERAGVTGPRSSD